MPSRQQLKQLQKALISAFPSKSLLERLLYFELEKNLNEITRESDLQEIVFKLIQTAEAQGWLEELIRAAYNENCGNLLLQVIVQELLTEEITQASSPNIPQQPSNQQQKILLLAALPNSLRLDKEIREIEEAIKRAVKRDSFEIKIRTAVRPQDIRRTLAEERPQIVHFCGHGMEDGSLVLEDDGGNHKAVLPTALAALFKLHTDYVKCILLNACYSALPAEAISKHINYVIGMNHPIEDRAAIVFGQGFYDGLGYDNIDNKNVIQRAFDEGIVAIQLENLLQGTIPSIWKLGIAQREIESINRNNDGSSNRNEQEAQRVQRQREQLEYENNLRRYEQELYQALKAGYPLDKFVYNGLKDFQQSLGIRDEDVVPIEERLLAPKQAKDERQQEAIKREQEQIILENQRRQAEFKQQEQRKSSAPISNADDDLSSDCNVDYTQLRDLLTAQKWKAADKETFAVMLKATGREEEGWLNTQSIEKFPCTDLRTIDQLWVKYSKGKFGFSVQKRIWKSLGQKVEKFGNRVGWTKGYGKGMNKEWKEYFEVTFDTSAPIGHLPVILNILLSSCWLSLLSHPGL